ncbi:MAG: fasciclin domain-containing protein, partial [Chitinophagaceae bacterium]
MFSCADSATDTAGSADSTGTMTTTTTDAAGTTDTMAASPDAMGGTGLSPSKNIVENAIASPDHSTLVAAVQAAELAGTLSGAGPFTVFAPTNAAFEKLPAGAVDNLLKPESKQQLTNVLTYHVVPGTYKAADLKDGQKLKTVQGKELAVTMKDGKVMIDGATVATPDVVSSN